MEKKDSSEASPISNKQKQPAVTSCCKQNWRNFQGFISRLSFLKENEKVSIKRKWESQPTRAQIASVQERALVAYRGVSSALLSTPITNTSTPKFSSILLQKKKEQAWADGEN